MSNKGITCLGCGGNTCAYSNLCYKCYHDDAYWYEKSKEPWIGYERHEEPDCFSLEEMQEDGLVFGTPFIATVPFPFLELEEAGHLQPA
jgi:hypothetical protein